MSEVTLLPSAGLSAIRMSWLSCRVAGLKVLPTSVGPGASPPTTPKPAAEPPNAAFVCVLAIVHEPAIQGWSLPETTTKPRLPAKLCGVPVSTSWLFC